MTHLAILFFFLTLLPQLKPCVQRVSRCWENANQFRHTSLRYLPPSFGVSVGKTGLLTFPVTRFLSLPVAV